MSKRLVPLNWRLMQDDGATPVSDGVLNFYLAGSTTPTTVYENKELMSPIGVTVDLDSIGYPEDVNVWGSDSISYKVGVQGTGFNGGVEKFFDYLEVAGSVAEAYPATGSSTAYEVTTGLFDGTVPTYSRISIIAPQTNASASITLRVDDLSPVQIKKRAGFLLSGGDMQSGGTYDLVYDGANWILQNPDSPVEVKIAGPVCGVRLSLQSEVAIPTTDQTAKTSIYAVPSIGTRCAVFNGAAFKFIDLASVTPLALDSNSGHTLYHQSGKNYDLYAFEDANGIPRIGTGAAWTNDVTQAETVTKIIGIAVNAAAITLRFGSGAANTQDVTINCATYLGTFRCTADGQTEDSKAKRFLWNMYNRVPRAMKVLIGTDSWTYTTATIRQANADTANQLAFVRGIDEDVVSADCLLIASNTNAGVVLSSGIGLDSTSTYAGGPLLATVTTPVAAYRMPMPSSYRDFPGLGYHFLSLNEFSTATGTTTWLGDNGAQQPQSGIMGVVMA